MSLPFVDEEALRRLLPPREACDALERAFAGPLPAVPQRSRMDVAGGELMLMPAAGEPGVGVKLVTIAPDNPARSLPLIHALYLLFDADSLAPVAAIDGSALTAIRTAAVSAVATRHLARAGSRRLALFGAGVQAGAHLESMRAVLPIEEVVVVSRGRDRAEELAAGARDQGLQAEVGSPDAVSDADVVCTCTTSSEPVFDGSALAPGTHVNAVGAYRPDMREIDSGAVAEARVVVETREAALAEAGDLLIPMGEGIIDASHIVADLAEVVRGAKVRRTEEEVTLFKSVGVAFEDLVLARAAADRFARPAGAPARTAP